ncbi:MAG: tetratricopeptide repeat protein [Pseudomonadota bacterium]
MTIIAILSFIVQLGLGFHCLKTGRTNPWLSIILFVPLVGSLLYFFTQMLPELRQDPTARRAMKTVSDAIDPQKQMRQKLEALAENDSASNRLELADECMRGGLFSEAQELYEAALTGPDEYDPHLLLKLAQSLFEQELYARARSVLEDLIEHNPEFQSADGHLLYAKTLEALQDKSVAEEYEVLLLSYPGEEARVRYGLYLKNQGEMERADKLFSETVAKVRRGPKHYKKAQQRWLDIAQANLEQGRPDDTSH